MVSFLYWFEIVFITLSLGYLFVGTFINNHAAFHSSKVSLPFSMIFTVNLIYLCNILIDSKKFMLINYLINDNYLYLLNNFTVLFKLMFLLFLITILFLLSSFVIIEKISFEYLLTLILSSLGSLVLISANDFFFVYLAIELQTFAFFILIVLDAKKASVVEAGLKYFILSAIASGFYLLGVLYVYYNTGLTNIHSLYVYLLYNNYLEGEYKIISIGFGLILITFLFKLALVPFHNWVVDVYDGTSLTTLLLLSILPKISIFIVFFRIYQLVLVEITTLNYLLQIIILVSVLIGSLGAISEYKIKRIIAYSSIVNSSFLLVGVCMSFVTGFNSSLWFIFVYFISMLGFLGYIYLLKSNLCFGNITNTESVSSIFFVNPVYGLLMCVYFFSLAGLPPYLSFFTKFYLLYNANIIFNTFVVWCIFMVNLLAFYFYIRFVRMILFFNNSNEYYYALYYKFERRNVYLLVLITYIQLFYMYYFSILLHSNYLFIFTFY